MIDVFCAVSLNNKIAFSDDFDIFKKQSSKSLMKFRNDFRNRYNTIIVGANTVKMDNPVLLNSNSSNFRFIIDKYGDIRLDSNIFTIKPEQTFVFLLKENHDYITELNNRGVTVILCSENNLTIKIKEYIKGDALIEGGGKTIDFFLKQKIVDNINLVIFPFILPFNSTGLFNDADYIKMKLVSNKLIDNKYVYLRYCKEVNNEKNDAGL